MKNDNKLKYIYLNEKEKLDMLNNNDESYQTMKTEKIKVDVKRSKKCLINYEEIKDENIPPRKTRKRSDSVDLYKKNRRDKERKGRTSKESNKSIKSIKDNPTSNNNNAKDEGQNTVNIKKINKSPKNCKLKKVTFQKPNFITIIDVESYKKFNEENTCKDPFEDLEFLQNINNYNNFNNSNFNINLNNNNINKNDDKNGEEGDGKEKVMCSCLII